MRPFAPAIDEPMLFQIGDELPDLARHTDNIIDRKNCKARRFSVHPVAERLELANVASQIRCIYTHDRKQMSEIGDQR